MSLYSYSPWLATILNLTILAISLVAFLWVYRRVNYYKELIAGPALAWLAPRWFGQRGSTFAAFVESNSRGWPKYLPVTIVQQGEQYQVAGRRGFNRFEYLMKGHSSLRCKEGWICQRLNLKDAHGNEFVFCMRRWIPGDAFYQSDSRQAAPSV